MVTLTSTSSRDDGDGMAGHDSSEGDGGCNAMGCRHRRLWITKSSSRAVSSSGSPYGAATAVSRGSRGNGPLRALGRECQQRATGDTIEMGWEGRVQRGTREASTMVGNCTPMVSFSDGALNKACTRSGCFLVFTQLEPRSVDSIGQPIIIRLAGAVQGSASFHLDCSGPQQQSVCWEPSEPCLTIDAIFLAHSPPPCPRRLLNAGHPKFRDMARPYGSAQAPRQRRQQPPSTDDACHLPESIFFTCVFHLQPAGRDRETCSQKQNGKQSVLPHDWLRPRLRMVTEGAS